MCPIASGKPASKSLDLYLPPATGAPDGPLLFGLESSSLFCLLLAKKKIRRMANIIKTTTGITTPHTIAVVCLFFLWCFTVPEVVAEAEAVEVLEDNGVVEWLVVALVELVAVELGAKVEVVKL